MGISLLMRPHLIGPIEPTTKGPLLGHGVHYLERQGARLDLARDGLTAIQMRRVGVKRTDSDASDVAVLVKRTNIP